MTRYLVSYYRYGNTHIQTKVVCASDSVSAVCQALNMNDDFTCMEELCGYLSEMDMVVSDPVPVQNLV